MKKVLLPTDFYENAWNAIVYAMEMHKNMECQFYILNVYNANTKALLTTMSSRKIGRLYDIAKTDSDEGLKNTAQDIENSKTPELHSIHFLSELGPTIEVLKSMVQAKQIDVIVMITAGITITELLFFG